VGSQAQPLARRLSDVVRVMARDEAWEKIMDRYQLKAPQR
jgi:hypothetical protein